MSDDASELGGVAFHFNKGAAECGLLLALGECVLERATEAVLLPLYSQEILNVLSRTRAWDHANPRQSLRLFGGGGGNRTAGSSPDSDDSRTVSRTGVDGNTSKEHEQNALPDILMTMSQIPDVNRELAEVGAVHAIFAAVRRERGQW